MITSSVLNISSIPENARVWTYAFSKPLSAIQLEWLEKTTEAFTANWKAHGHQLKAGHLIIDQIFLVLYVDESHQAATGCSIDDSVAFIKQIGDHFKSDLTDKMRIYFRRSRDAGIDFIPFTKCKQIAEAGELEIYQSVFDFSADRWGVWNERFEKPLNQSFLAKWLKSKNAD